MSIFAVQGLGNQRGHLALGYLLAFMEYRTADDDKAVSIEATKTEYAAKAAELKKQILASRQALQQVYEAFASVVSAANTPESDLEFEAEVRDKRQELSMMTQSRVSIICHPGIASIRTYRFFSGCHTVMPPAPFTAGILRSSTILPLTGK